MTRSCWLTFGSTLAVLGAAQIARADECRKSCIGDIPCHVEVTSSQLAPVMPLTDSKY
jgi:hypothetical protein